MGLINPLMKYILLSLGCLLIASCSTLLKPSDPIQHPLSFNEAISTLTDNLLLQVKADLSLSGQKDATHVMLIPFTNADSHEVPEASRKIEELIIEEGRRNFKVFQLTRLTSKNISHADYIINGTIQPDTYVSKDTVMAQKHYRVYGEVMRTADKKIIGKSNLWLYDISLNNKPMAIYRESPLYLNRRRLTKPEKTERQARMEGLLGISLQTMAVLTEGRTAYENGDYETAAELFSLATERKDGQDLDTYAGLYLANYKLGRFKEAEKAFAKVVSISVEKYRFLTVKYLFDVDSLEYLQDKNLKERYDVWIRNIGKYFHNTSYCLEIVGHASRSGSKAYNDRLSLERAKSIQKQLYKSFPEVFQRSEVVGKGFSNNIVGTGTDDERDALDRRVELFIVDCK